MAEQQQIGMYRIIRSLGGGGMGVVYLAEDAEGGGLYALKLLSPSMTLTEKESRRFRREFMTMSRLRHPNIVEVYESGVYEDSLYFVMEYVKGSHLRERFLPHPYPDAESARPAWLSEMNQPRRLEALLRAMIQICDALSWIHAHGIIHRDLKPENILVKTDGQVKLLDFGIAKRLGGSELTQSKSILGTFTYISPEQAQCEDVDGRADLYSLGVIFYEILAGRAPFISAEPIGRLYMHLNKPAPPLRDWNPQLHPSLETIILRLLQKDPADRYQTAQALRDDLESFLLHIAPHQDPYTSHEGERILREPAFVGRSDERQILMRHLDLLRSGKGGLVLLSGHTGIGKTRLAREFLASARAFQIECCTVRCHPESPPYAAFQEIIEQLRTTLSLREVDLPQRLWGRSGEIWFRMMDNPSKPAEEPSPQPLGFTMDTLTPSSGSAEDEKIQLFEAVRQMLEAFLMHEPLLFCLDDLMFADEMSLELTEYLIRTLEASPTPHKLLLLANFRNEDVGTSHPINQMMVRLTPLRLYALHDLKPMPEDTIAQMALSMLGSPLAPDALRTLSEQSQGNPFFIEELLKAWWDDRLLVEVEDLYTLLPSELSDDDSLRVGRLPLALQKRLSRRISRLSPPSYGLAQWMAVLHHDSSFDTLSRLTKIDDDSLLSMLDELLQQKILAEDWASGAELYRFSHPGIQELLYSQMADEQKSHAHRTVADLLRHDSRTEAAFESIAQHYLLAGDTDQGAWFLLLATERQIRAFAHRSAWELSQRCQRLLLQASSPHLQPKTPWWWRYHLATLELMDVIGHYREGLELAEYALAALDDSDDPTPFLRWQAVFSREMGFYLEALACVKQALAHPRLQDDLRLYLLQESGRVYRVQGRYSAALEAYREALAWAVDRKLVWEQGRISAMIGKVLHQRGEFADAEAHYLRALEIAVQAADRRGEVESLCKLGALELDKGYVAESIQRFEKAIQLARELGDRRMEGTALALLGQLQSDRRLYDDAQEKLEYALLIAQEIGDQRMEGELLSWLGLLCYRRQHLDAARYYLEEGITKVRQLGDRLLELWIRCYLCVVELLEKRSTQEDALEEMNRIARLSEQMDASEIVLLCKLVTAHIYRLLRQKEPAKDFLTAARFLAQEVGNRRLLAKIESERYLLGLLSA